MQEGEDPLSPTDAQHLGIATVYQDLALCENLNVVREPLPRPGAASPARLDEVGMEVKAWELLRQLSAKIPTVRIPVASLSGGTAPDRGDRTVPARRTRRSSSSTSPPPPSGVAQTAEVLNLVERLREKRPRGRS